MHTICAKGTDRKLKLVADMERKGVISSSVSPWASPVVLVAKKDG